MHWDALAAIASVLQAVLIAAAAAVALVQIRHLNHQNELAAFVQLMATWNSPDVRRARHFVTDELAERLHDPQYLREIAEGRLASHPETLVLNHLNQVGHLITSGVVKPELLLGEQSGVAWMMWQHLLPVIALRRAARPTFMINFEAFVIRSEGFDAEAIFARLRERTPPALQSKWDDHRREIVDMHSEMLRRLEATTAPVPD